LVPYGFYQRTSAKISGQYFFTQKNGTAESHAILNFSAFPLRPLRPLR
jgi:hypothetical protein